MLAVCPPRAFLYGMLEGKGAFFEEGELLCSENTLFKLVSFTCSVQLLCRFYEAAMLFLPSVFTREPHKEFAATVS